MRRPLLLLLATLCGCAMNSRPDVMMADEVGPVRETRHDAPDDLLTAGLGLAGLRGAAPAVAVPEAPTPEELRRRAIYANWRGIADVAPGGGLGELYGRLDAVPGREYSAFARLPGSRAPHRVLAQVPDRFDLDTPCLVVTPVSGSRGVYGSIAFAGGWALPRGCAVVYTDKGAGTDLFDVDSGTGVALDGTRAAADALGFKPEDKADAPHRVAFRHAHSGDNPEAQWGEHTLQAARFGLQALSRAFPERPAFTFANTRVILFGLSNGAGAVLRAAESPGSEGIAAVVAVAPQLHVEGARPLFDYGTLAGLYQPCALLDPRAAGAPQPLPAAMLEAAGRARCQSLIAAGLLRGPDERAAIGEAYDRLQAHGFTPGAMRAGAINVAFDLWRALGATYLPAYTRAGTGSNACGYAFAAVDAQGQPRATTVAERALWWSDSSGLAPGAGVQIVDTKAAGADPSLPGLRCLRDAWEGSGEVTDALREGVRATQATGAPRVKSVVIVHGIDDGLVPLAFTSAPWAERARRQGANVRLYQIEHAQHFDAFLGLPGVATHYVPLMPFAWAAMDATMRALDGAELPDDAVLATRPRAAGEALTREHLGDIDKLDAR